MSVTRYYTKDKSLMDTLLGLGAEADWYNNSLTIRIQDWDSLGALTKTTINTDVLAAGYQFDHDETV